MKLLHVGNRRNRAGEDGGGLRRFDDRCTHKAARSPTACLACGTVTCPWHGSQFDVKTGALKAGPRTPLSSPTASSRPTARCGSFPLTRLSDSQATAAILWSRLRRHSGEAVRHRTPKTSYSHICNRSAPSMSVNVGITFVPYHGRSLTTCEPSWPFTQYHRIVSDPRTTPSGALAPRSARSTPAGRAARGAACCRKTRVPHTIFGSIPGSPNGAEDRRSVATSASSRPLARGSRTSTTSTGSVLLPRYQSTFADDLHPQQTRLLREVDLQKFGGVGLGVLDSSPWGSGGDPPSSATPPSGRAGVGGQVVQRRLPVQGPDHLEVLGSVPQHRRD